VHVKARFLLPLTPVLCGLAGSAMVVLAARAGTARESAIAVTPRRLGAGALLAALLLFLAFGGPLLDASCTS
jgi:hypothetical protein